jgi:ribosomal protein S19
MVFFFKKDIIFHKKLINKIPFIPFYLLKLPCIRRKRQKFFLDNNINLYRKSVRIIRPFLYYKFYVYVGGKLRKILILNNSTIGYRFGEFFMTRRFGSGALMHARKKKKSKK